MSILCDYQIVTDLEGNFIVQIGSTGEEGFQDGSFEDAAFNRPQVHMIISLCISCSSIASLFHS